MTLLLLYWGIMILCYLAACRLRAYGDRFGFISGALNGVIYILVFIMGLRMGANEEVTSSLGTIGLQSLFITVFTVAGSMMAVTVLRKILGLNKLGLPATDVYACDETAEPEIGTVAVSDDAGDTGVGSSSTGIEHFSQIMAPLGFHHRVHVLPSGEAGAEGHGDGGHAPAGA